MALRVVFLHYHGIGHINPCLPLARILQEQSHEVHFAGFGFFKKFVNAQGFKFHALTSVPFGLGFETWVNAQKKNRFVYLSCLKDRITDQLYHDRERDLLMMLAQLKPDVLFIDGTQATDFIVLYPHLIKTNIRVGVVNAMFPTYVLPGRPPVNSDAFPEDHASCHAAMVRLNDEQHQKAKKQKLRYLFFDDRYIVDRRIKRNRVPQDFRSKIPSLFYYNTAGIPEFVLAPREFDYPTFRPPIDQHFVGFMMNPIKHVPDPEYLQVKQLLIDDVYTLNTKILYCSFGTIETEHREVIISFLNKLIQVIENFNYRLIISMGAQRDNMRELMDSQHVYLFASVPQLDVLTYADLFITHGGLSSIKESIHAGVPMMMYPVHTDFDPIGNAARVEYHGLGLRGNAATDTVSIIQKKIATLMWDTKYKKNVLAMKAKNATYTATNFLKLFDKLQPIR